MSIDPVELVYKIDFEQFINAGVGIGYEAAEVEVASHDCGLVDDELKIAVVYRAYIGKVGPFAREESRVIIRKILNELFDSHPDMNSLFILEY